MASCKCIPDHIAAHVIQYARFAVVGMFASSALMLVIRCWCMKLFVIMGLSALLLIEHQPFSKVPCVGCVGFWEKVSMIGAMVYLMGVDC